MKPELDLFASLKSLVSKIITPELNAWGVGDMSGEISLERPAMAEHGDLSLNIAMAAASRAGKPPRQLAEELLHALETDDRFGDLCSDVSIAGPGFINIFIADKALAEAVTGSLARGDDFGRGIPAGKRRILLEYVSANPTGPLHAGHARYAAYGDSLHRIISFAGDSVKTEFYINDYGSQMELFGRSLAARYAQALGADAELPEDAYKGEYLVAIAERIAADDGDRWLSTVLPEPGEEAVGHFSTTGSRLILEDIRVNLERFRVSFDSWFSEASLYENDHLGDVIRRLEASGDVYHKDGAIWLRTTRQGDDKDRVLVRKSGEPTYFASDIVYHQEKLSRGFDHLINIWGADHHGYVQRMKAAFSALAEDPGKLEIIIGQLVNVLEMGEKQQMSKRAGKMVTLEELLDSIGVDAARFFLVDRSHDSTLDLDLEKAKLKSEENPVYYVQYAHARICSILRKAAEDRVDSSPCKTTVLQPQERNLVLKLLEFPGIIQTAAATRGPHRLTAYMRELAAVFHVFYHKCPVLRAEPDQVSFRMDLCRLTGNTIRIALGLVGVSAPESM